MSLKCERCGSTNLPCICALMAHCPSHGEVPCPKCQGAIGGHSKSERKLAAIRENAKKGGRPKKSKDLGLPQDTRSLSE